MRLLLALFLSLLPVFAAMEKPVFEQMFPAGAPPGTTNEISIFGKFEPWPPMMWSSVPGLEFQFTTNKGKATLVIGSDAPVGPCLVRAFNSEGASDPRIFVVSDDRHELLEIEPNNHFTKAQALTHLPATVNGRLEKNGDVDCYRITLKAGEWLDAKLDSYTLMAKLDPVLRLLGTNGYQLAWNHDFASLDPRLIWRTPMDMTAVLQVFGFAYPADSDIRLSGGPAGAYRLHVSTCAQPPSDLRTEPTEHEPNDTTNNAPRLELAAHIVGAIGRNGDIDRFRFFATNGQFIEARVSAASIGSPLDAWIAIESTQELARSDDNDNSRDPRLEWTAPAEGEYYVVLGSTTHHGGPEFRYKLALTAPSPDYTLTAAVDAVMLVPGTTNTLKLNLKRYRGFTNELRAITSSMPEGVTCAPITLPVKDGEATLTFLASTNVLATNLAFRVVAKDVRSSEERAIPFELVSRTENNGVPGGYTKLLVEKTDQLWMTVKPPSASPEKK